MRRLLLSMVMIATLISCQKDFYLDDLKAAEAEIAQLKKDKSQLTSEINTLSSELNSLTTQFNNLTSANQALMAQIEELQSELADVKAKLEATELDLDDANAIIADLRVEIAALEIKIAEEEGTVESLTKALENLQALLDVSNGENERLQELIDGLKDDIAVLEGFKNAVYKVFSISRSFDNDELNDAYGYENSNGDGYYDFTDINNVKSVYSRWLRHGLDSGNGKHYFIWADMGLWDRPDSIGTEVVGHNHYRFTTYTLKTFHYNGEKYEDVTEKISYEVSISDYNQASNYYTKWNPDGIVTVDQIQDELRATGAGLYGDDIYKTLDFNDINDYIRVFKLDAKRHGINKDYITNQETHLVFDDLPSGVCAWASYVCNQEFIWIEYDELCWGIFPDDPFDPDRLEVMYHELGHSIMSYPHPLVDDDRGWPYNVGAGHNGVEDIMGYSSIRYSSDGETYESNGHSYKDISWDEAVDRFFAGTDHTVYNCGSGKGNIIVVNEEGNPDFE